MHIIKRICTVVSLLLVGTLLISLASCAAGGVPDGTYSCVAADTGEVYIFEGSKVRVTLYLLGNATEDYTGSYSVEGDSITFRFPQDKDGIYSGTFSYSIADDGESITIDGQPFVKGEITIPTK